MVKISQNFDIEDIKVTFSYNQLNELINLIEETKNKTKHQQLTRKLKQAKYDFQLGYSD